MGFALVGPDALAVHVHSFRPDSALQAPAAPRPAGGDRDSAALCGHIAAALSEFLGPIRVPSEILGPPPPVAVTARRGAKA